MNWFEKLKRFFKNNAKVRRLTETTDNIKAISLIKKEKDKVQEKK